MPSVQWAMKDYHRKWYAGETISVGIGQGAVQATPLQLARIIGGIASDGHLVRPHVVFPDQLPGGFSERAAGEFSRERRGRHPNRPRRPGQQLPTAWRR